MAKRKSKSKSTNLLIAVVVIAFAALAICTLFMPVLTTKLTVLKNTTTSNVTGKDMLVALFNGEVSTDFTEGANRMILLKNSDDDKVVATIFLIAYFATVCLCGVSAVLALLSILGIKLKMIAMLIGVVAVIGAIVTLIFAFIVVGKFSSLDWGSLATVKNAVAIGGYLTLGGVLAGGALAYGNSK